MSNKIEVMKNDLMDKELERKLIHLSEGFIEPQISNSIIFLARNTRREMVRLLKESNIPYKSL